MTLTHVVHLLHDSHCGKVFSCTNSYALALIGQHHLRAFNLTSFLASIGNVLHSSYPAWIQNLILLLLFSCSVLSNSVRLQGPQHSRSPCPSPSPRACSNSCPWSQWCHPTILSSVIPFSCLQSFPASGSFLMSWLFTSSGQSIGASASASVLPMNIQGWCPSGLSGLISLQFKGLSRVFSNATVQKPQFFSAQLSLWSNSHIHTWLLENCTFDYIDLCQQNWCHCFLIHCLGWS